jgi:hypothetical protein
MKKEKSEISSSPPNINYESDIQEIGILVKAENPLIYVVTHEEQRFLTDLYTNVAVPYGRVIFTWSQFTGLIPYGNPSIRKATGDLADTTNPSKALLAIDKMDIKAEKKKGGIFVMLDMHTCLVQPIPRQIRDIYDNLIGSSKTLIITAPSLAYDAGGRRGGAEPTLEKLMTVVYYKLPNRELITKHVNDAIGYLGSSENAAIKKDYSSDEVFQITRTLQGLTIVEIGNAISTSVSHLQEINPEKLLKEKRQIIQKSEILEYIDTNTGIEDIGGMDEAKRFVQTYKNTSTDEAIAFGVEPLKGILLTGVPGTGKSQLAKAIGKVWGVPILRLDVGKVMTGLVGGSEEKMRSVLEQAESMAPCVTGDTLITLAGGKQLTIEELYKLMHRGPHLTELNIIGYNPATAQIIPIHLYTIIRRDALDKQLLEITTETGQIRVTEDHKLLTNRGWVKAKDLSINDEIIEPGYQKETLTHSNSLIISGNAEIRTSQEM